MRVFLQAANVWEVIEPKVVLDGIKDKLVMVTI